MTELTHPSLRAIKAFPQAHSTRHPFPKGAHGITALALGLAVLVSALARDARAIGYNVDETTVAAFGNLNQANVGPNGTNGNNFCAPTATMNSFTWLANAYPAIYGNMLMGGQATWLAAGMLLAGPAYMNTDKNNGTTEGNWVGGKVGYINNFAPNTTTFAGMDSVATPGRPAWDQNANPTANFLLQQLQGGEDVELGISPTVGNNAGHVLTLTGISWNDANNNGIFDAGDTLTLNTIDPANPGVNTPLTLTPGANGMKITGGAYGTYVMDAALAESPVPEPATLSLALMGGAAIGFLRNRRAKI
jgi:hypothetical protein